jgi:hypothetical protein
MTVLLIYSAATAAVDLCVESYYNQLPLGTHIQVARPARNYEELPVSVWMQMQCICWRR